MQQPVVEVLGNRSTVSWTRAYCSTSRVAAGSAASASTRSSSSTPSCAGRRTSRFTRDFSLSPELRSMALKPFGLAEPIRAALMPYADRIEEAFVFGSIVKGSDTGRSDVDVMIVGTVPQLELFEAA